MLNDGEDTLRIGYFAVIDPASDVQVKEKNNTVELKNRGPGNAVAQGFTLALRGSDGDSDSDSESEGDSDSDDDSDSDVDHAAIKAMGYRTSTLSGFQVVEIGVDLQEAWETMSDLTFDLYLDVDSDGSDDVLLRATD